MKRRANLFFIIALISSLFVVSCATTKLTSVWHNSGYTGGTLNKILVVGDFEKISNRRIFEDQLAEQLKSLGTDAISSAAVISADKELNAQTLKTAARNLNADAVLVTHLEGLKEESVYYPPVSRSPVSGYNNRFGYSYRSSAQYTPITGYTAKYKMVIHRKYGVA